MDYKEKGENLLSEQKNVVISDFLITLVLITVLFSASIAFQKSTNQIFILDITISGTLILITFSILYFIIKITKDLLFFKNIVNQRSIQNDYILVLLIIFILSILTLFIFLFY